jgi:hypothetical protein
MKYDINNDLSKLNEWTKLWLVDCNPKKTKARSKIVKCHQQISVLDYPSCLLYRLCRVEKEEVQVLILGEHQL